MHDYDPRIVALYDLDNPDGPDHDFYRALAAEIGASRIVDIGCGTGILTVTFTGPGRTVIGVDPSASMLEYARQRPGGADVTWILGDSSAIGPGTFDYAVLTGNVAQHIPHGQWERTLADLRSTLRPGGTVAFESRNPSARAWLDWTSPPSTRSTADGDLQEWSEIDEIAPGVIRLTAHNRFLRDDDHVVETEDRYFRSHDQITAQLSDARFTELEVYGGWQREPFTGSERVMVFVARSG